MISNDFKTEFNLLCNRVNQLEKLVITQAREIYDLKRTVHSLQTNNNKVNNLSPGSKDNDFLSSSFNNSSSNRNSSQIFVQQQHTTTFNNKATTHATTNVVPSSLVMNGAGMVNTCTMMEQQQQQQNNQQAPPLSTLLLPLPKRSQQSPLSTPQSLTSNRNSMINLPQQHQPQQSKQVLGSPPRFSLLMNGIPLQHQHQHQHQHQQQHQYQSLNNNASLVRGRQPQYQKHPYSMNPMVHPTSAIPPMSNTKETSASLSTSSPPASPPSTTTTTTNKGSFASTDGGLNTTLTVDSNEKLGRQSLVESDESKTSEVLEEGELPPSPQESITSEHSNCFQTTQDDNNNVDHTYCQGLKRKRQEEEDELDTPIYLSFDKSPSGKILYFKHSDPYRRPTAWDLNSKSNHVTKAINYVKKPNQIIRPDSETQDKKPYTMPPSLRKLLENSPFA